MQLRTKYDGDTAGEIPNTATMTMLLLSGHASHQTEGGEAENRVEATY